MKDLLTFCGKMELTKHGDRVGNTSPREGITVK